MNTETKKLKVYVAGPDVFRKDAEEFFKKVVQYGEKIGVEILVPLDPSLTRPRQIFYHNVRQLDACDCVVANVDVFRGAEPDSGTAWEIGYACAKGKLVIAYCESDDRTVEQKHLAYFNLNKEEYPGNILPDQMSTERWGYKTNLMLWFGVRDHITGNVFAALDNARWINQTVERLSNFR